MTIKNIYVHPGDVLKIHFVRDKDEPATKAAFDAQNDLHHKPVMLITARDCGEIGYCDPSHKFRYENPDGSLRRWLS